MSDQAKKKSHGQSGLTLLKQRIKQGDTSGVFIFYGGEEYVKRHYFSLLAAAAGKDGFNRRVFFDKEVCSPELIDSLDIVPSFDSAGLFGHDLENERSVPPVRRVIKLVNPDFGSIDAAAEKALLSRLSALSGLVSAVLYFYDAGEDNAGLLSKGLVKKIAERALVVEFRREQPGSAALLKWISRHFRDKGVVAEPRVVSYFCAHVGNDMSTLQNEMEKLCAYVKYNGGTVVRIEDIDTVCIRDIQARIYDISNNALGGNFEKAMEAFFALRDMKTDWLFIFGTLAKAVSDMCNVEYYLKRGCPYIEISQKTGLRDYPIKKYHAILTGRDRGAPSGARYAEYASTLCSVYDRRLKRSKTDNYELLEELIFKLAAGK